MRREAALSFEGKRTEGVISLEVIHLLRGIIGGILVSLLLLIPSFAPGAFGGDPAEGFAKELKRWLRKGERVAVSYIYDGDNSDITAYGDRWRSRIEAALSRKGVTVVPRKDIVLFIEDVESFRGEEEGDLWRRFGAEVVIVGRYYVEREQQRYTVEMLLKALRVGTGELFAREFRGLRLSAQDRKRLVKVLGNVARRRFEGLSKKSLFLEARLNKECFLPGEMVRISIRTEPGVHLFIFNIAADGSITRLMPNRFLPATVYGRRFEFPPKKAPFSLVMQAFPGRDLAYESFKVIASRRLLSLPRVPVPVNRVFVKMSPESLKELVRTVERAREVSVVDLPYWVGEGCRTH